MANIASTTASAGTEVTARALRESVFAGLITLGLFVLFVGLKTDQNIRNELILTQRWGLLAIFVIIAMVGRFLMVAYVQPWLAQRKAAKAAAPEVAKEESFFSRNFSKIAIVALILYPPVIVALFGAGVKLDRALTWRNWRTTALLLAIAMPLTIAGMAVVGTWLVAMTLPGAVLLGAILAPTDPVLADDVQVGGPMQNEPRTSPDSASRPRRASTTVSPSRS